MLSRLPPPPTPPMPGVRERLVNVPELRAAVERVASSWNRTQLEDACRSVQFWLDTIKPPPTEGER